MLKVKENLKIEIPNNCKVRIKQWKPETHHGSALEVQISSGGLAHAPEWYGIIQKSYGHTPIYIEAVDEAGNTARLPAFLIRRPFFGTVITSMPFLDKGGPFGNTMYLAKVLIENLIEEAKRSAAKFVELRSECPLDLNVPPEMGKVSLVLQLPDNADELWRNLDAKVRNQVRKANRSGLKVDIGGREMLPTFYRTFSIKMRDLGSPVHSYEFFNEIFNAFGERARVALVLKEDKAVGGLIALESNDTMAVPWASSLRQYFRLCPNMILYWEILRYACDEGFGKFDFGRSSRDAGTYRFKRQWGAEAEPLYWYTIPVANKSINKLSASDARGRILRYVWSHLPWNLSRWLGPKFRKYLTQ